MKIKLAIIMGCTSLFFHQMAFAADPGCYKQCGQAPSGPPYQCYSQNCECTDPACSVKNDCLSRSECCEAFGNVGGST